MAVRNGATGNGAARNGATWAAFLVMCFAVVGLMGLFASYAGPIPLERALARDATFDAALDAARQADASQRLEALRPALGESAETVLAGQDPIEARVVRARAAFRQQALAESAAVTTRVRLLLLVVTLMAAAFGVGVMGLSRRP